MTLKILSHHLIELPIILCKKEEELEEHGLDVRKEKDRDEGQAEDHHDQDEVDYKEEERVILVDPAQWANIVGNGSKKYEHDCDNHLIQGEAHFFKSLN